MTRIRTTIFAVLGVIAMSAQVHAQSCTELFKKANSLRADKNYGDAITYYQRAMNCDANLKADCDKWITYCRKRLPVLEVSDTTVTIPWQGSDKQIMVKANGKWHIEGDNDWLTTDASNSKNFIVQCREANNETRDKEQTLFVKNGDLYKSVKVVQKGRPEYIEAGAKSLSFPADGNDDNVSIESNVSWDVIEVPSWCKIEKKDDGIHIIVSKNDRTLERNGDIVIKSPSYSVTIKINQAAGDEHLALSQNNIVLDANGDTHYLKVYTDASNWFVGDFPSWMNVTKVGKDSIRIECGKNIPNGETRSGSVQVRTDRQSAGVLVSQAPRFAQVLIFPDTKLVGGRNFSLGVSASYYMPFVSTSAGGDYVGSVLDYGLGTSAENASYKSATGFSFGLFADLRLYKNIFLIAGVNYTHIKYKNTFNKNTTYTMPYSSYEYLSGEVQNSYTEDYTHSMIEVPIMASYRFKTSNVSHIQLNLGPVLNFGLSSKMKLSGNTNSQTMRRYNSTTHQPSNSSNYLRNTAVNAKFNLYQPCVYWEEQYTSGNDATVPHHDKFQSSPLKKFNCGLRAGVAYEWAGISAGIYYTYMFTNMANKNYWDNERWTVLNVSDKTMKGYKQRINTLEFKLAYTLRYIKTKK